MFSSYIKKKKQIIKSNQSTNKNRIQDLQLIIMAIIVYSRNQTEYFWADLIETQFMNRNLKARKIDSF